LPWLGLASGILFSLSAFSNCNIGGIFDFQKLLITLLPVFMQYAPASRERQAGNRTTTVLSFPEEDCRLLPERSFLLPTATFTEKKTPGKSPGVG
jgi:hypothetical protein